MLNKTKLTRIAAAVALSVGLASTAVAQETSSGIRGTVVSDAGSIVAGATVTLTDTRTGSVKVLTTNESGNFSTRGLRVGGPYTVVVNDAQGTRTLENIFLNLGEPVNLTVELEDDSIENIVVTGSTTGIVFETKGPSSTFTFEDLQFQPSVDRDIKDVIQNDPRITIDPSNSNAIQCGGANNRFNSITVDGISQNDNFGLNNNGYPTERLPFPFDAIDQVAVELAPYDVQYGGFTGCNVNAVIRSGTNEVHGSVFYDYTNDSMTGDSIEGDKFDVADFDESRYGFTVGFPVIKDKLFVFAAYEKHNPITFVENGPEGAGFAEPIEGLDLQTLERIRNIAQTRYGYTAGDIINSADEKEEKMLLKVDWNINEDHRASLTYQNTDGNTISTSGTGTRSYAFSDRYYERANELTTYSLQVFSDWTENFSTEIRYGDSEIKNGQKPFTSDPSFGDVEISNAVPGVDVLLGADQFRQANILNYDTTTFKLAGTYYYGDHEITGGYEYEEVDVFNLFVPGSQGRFFFNSIDDFEAGIAQQITYNIPGSLDPNDGAAEFTFETSTFYIQDRWLVNDDLTLTFGLRYDQWTSDDDPIANPRFEQRYGFSNGNGPDFDLVQPRVGFNYIYDDVTFIYGGVGLFAGGNPNVWLSNNYSNNGVSILASAVEREDGNSQEQLDALDGNNTPNFLFEVPQYLVDNLTGGDGAVNALDPDFEVPSVWKWNIGVQREFDYNINAGFDIIYTDQQDSAKTIALNSQLIGTAPDGRPVYKDADMILPECQANPASPDCTGRPTTDYLLTNSDVDGSSTVISAFIDQSFDNGFSWSGGYAWMDAEDASPMNSSTASSNYGNLSVIDLNNPAVATSNYEVEHRFTLNLSYSHEFFDGYATRVNMFAQRVKGKPYSYNFDGDPGFGDERPWEDRTLLYVPAGPGANDDPIVQYGEGFDLEAFNQFIQDAGLEGARGTILSRNTQNSDWWSRVDLRVTQEIPGFMKEHRGSIFFSIQNLGNLLNDDWGVYRQVNFEYNNPVVDATINGDQFIFTNFDGDRGQSVDSEASTWSMRVGVKYTF